MKRFGRLALAAAAAAALALAPAFSDVREVRLGVMGAT